jgi:hypothetical protein
MSSLIFNHKPIILLSMYLMKVIPETRCVPKFDIYVLIMHAIPKVVQIKHKYTCRQWSFSLIKIVHSQLRSWAWYGSLELIPGPIWKMSCNNLLLLIFTANTSANLIVIKEKLEGRCEITPPPPQWQVKEWTIFHLFKYFCFEFCTMTVESVCKFYPRRWHFNGNSYSRRRIHLS